MIRTNLLNGEQAGWLLPQLEKRFAYMTETKNRSKHKYTKVIAAALVKIKANQELVTYTSLEKLMIVSCVNENIDECGVPQMAKSVLEKCGYKVPLQRVLLPVTI